MSLLLRYATAGQVIKLPKMLDSTDGDTEETGLTIANTDIILWKEGATAGVSKNSGGATHVSNGDYYCTLDATDTNTLGGLAVETHISGALYNRIEFTVLPAVIFDALVAGTDYLQADIVQLLGTALQTPNTAGLMDVNTIQVSGTTQTANDNGADINDILTDTGTTIPALIAALNNLSSTDVQSATDAAITANALILAIKVVTDSITDLDTLVAGVWNALLTGATFNIATSAGRRLRELGGDIVLTGTSPGTGNTAIRIELDSDASSTDGAYDPAIVVITAGTGAGQSRQIFEYDGTNKYAYVNRDWKTIPDDTSEYTIVGDVGALHTNEGVITGVTSNTITLNANASSIDDTYNDQLIAVTAGIGQDQARKIVDYDGTTKIATVDEDFITLPVAGSSVYAILPVYANLSQITDITDQFTFTDGKVDANATVTGGDATAANQEEIISMIESISGIPLPDDTTVCRVYTYVKLPDGTIPDKMSAIAQISSLPFDDNSNMYQGVKIQGSYNETNGLLYWDIVQGATVKFNIETLGYTSTKVIPTETSAELFDLE